MSTTSHSKSHAPPEQEESSNSDEDDEEVSDGALELFDSIAHDDRVCFNCLRPKLRDDERTEWDNVGAPPAAKARVCDRCGTGRPGDSRPRGGFACREWGRDRPLAARGDSEYTVSTILRRALARLAELCDQARLGFELSEDSVDAAYDRALELKTQSDEYASKDREVLAAGVAAALHEQGYEVWQDGEVVPEEREAVVAD